MPGHAADRNLLFGILALQMDLITRDALVAAMGAWALAKDRPIGEILVEAGAMDAVDRLDLEPMVDRRVARDGGEPARSLAGLTSATSLAEDLRRSMTDVDVLGSLTYVSQATPRHPHATRPPEPAARRPPGARYRKVRDHAEGGLGVVFVARDEELNREVALKEIKARYADNPASQARFLMEAEITGGLEHPGIVPVYGLGHYDDGRPYYAMRFIRGDSLKDAIAAFHGDGRLKADPGERTLALQKLLRRFLDVCDAVAYAHSRGVLHRDLKPDNVMVGKYGETLVVDWGLAKAAGRFSGDLDASGAEATLVPTSASGSDHTLPGSVIGTPAYMSPEQAAGRLDLLGPASDVYSLGATLYALLTGEAPFVGRDVGDVIRKVERGEFPRPRERSPWLDPAPEAICLKAMALRPEDRYPSPRSLAEDLERWIADEPVTALKESAGTRLRRWAKRNRTLVTGAASLLATAVVALTIATVLINGERLKTGSALAKERAAVAREKTALEESQNSTRIAEAAERRATAESLRARDEAAKVVGVIDVMVSTFRSSDPTGIEGIGVPGVLGANKQTLTAREILDRSVDLVDRSLVDQPLVRATLLDTIGDVYRSMAEVDQAAPLLKKAKDIRADRLAWDDPELATSLMHLGWLCQDQVRFDEAEALYLDAMARRTRRFGAASKEALEVKCHLALLWQLQEDVARSEPAFREVIEQLGRLPGDHKRNIAIARLGLTGALVETGKPLEAFIQIQQALGVLLPKAQSDQVLVAIASFQKGYALSILGQRRAALKIYRETLESMKRVVGPTYPYLVFFQHEIGYMAELLGDDSQAEASYRDSLDLTRKSVGLKYPRARILIGSLGKLLVRTGRAEEARALHQDRLAACRAAYGPAHPFVADALVSFMQSGTARDDEAAGVLGEALDIYRAQKKPPLGKLVTASHELAKLHLARARPRDAEAVLRETLPWAVAFYGEKNRNVGVIRIGLAQSLMDQSLYGEEAERSLTEAARLLRLPTDPKPEEGLKAVVMLGAWNYRLGRFDEAERLDREALDAAGKVFGDRPAARAPYARELAGISVVRGDLRGAIPLLEEGAKAAPEPGPAGAAGRIDAVSVLALLRAALGDLDEHQGLVSGLLREFPAVDGPGLLVGLTWTASRFPGPVDADRLGAMARRVLAIRPETEHTQLVGSVALLRAGRAEEAAGVLERLVRARNDEFIYGNSYLAIARHRLGRLDESRQARARAIAGIEKPEKFTRNWTQTLEMKVLRRELDRLPGGFDADLPADVFAR